MINLNPRLLGDIIEEYSEREHLDALILELVNGDKSAADRIYTLVNNVVKQYEADTDD